MVKLDLFNDNGEDVGLAFVKITYLRNEYGEPRDTVVELHNINDERISTGVACLHPKDKFCRAQGRKIAFAAAVKNITLKHENFPYTGKVALWRAYHAKWPIRGG